MIISFPENREPPESDLHNTERTGQLQPESFPYPQDPKIQTLRIPSVFGDEDDEQTTSLCLSQMSSPI